MSERNRQKEGKKKTYLLGYKADKQATWRL